MTVDARDDRGRRHRAAGLPRRRRQRRHQGQRRARPRAARLGRAGARRPRSSRPTGAGGAGPRLARAPRALRRRGARDRRQQRLRQRLHRRRRACRSRATWPPRPRALVGCPVEQVLVASTGVIGVALPIEKIRARPARGACAALGADQGALAARAIMTTDPFPKEAAAHGRDRRPRRQRSAAWPRAPGMIEPMMATMLGFVTTDAAVPQPLLDRALREAVDDTFNAITVDGECSTNDCVMLLANGASGATVDEIDLRRVRRTALTRRLPASSRSASCAAARARPSSSPSRSPAAASTDEARRAAKAIANSPLVKTAIHGGDPNWGRLIAVAGRAGVAFELSRAAVHDRTDRAVQGRPAVRRGGARGGRVPQGRGHRP